MIKPKKSLFGLERIGHPIKNRDKMVTLERNERTIDFQDDIIKEIAQAINGFNLRAYPDLDELYEKMSDWLGISSSQIFITQGADGGLKSVWDAYVEENDEVIILSPSYAMYPVYCAMYNAVPVEITYEEDLSLPLEKITSRINNNTRVVAVANPNQPIESLFNFDELKILAKKCLEHSSLLVVDEAYYHFSEVSAINLLDEFENVIIVRTFSKAFGVAGLRLGYTIAQDQTITYLKALKHIYEVNSITAAIGVYLIENLHIMKNYVDDVNKGRDILSSYFSSVGCNLHGLHSNTLLVELPKEYNCNKIEQVAKDAGYLIKSQVIYPTMNHLRITLGPPDQMQSFIKAIDWCFETK